MDLKPGLEIQAGGERLTLLPEKAIWWARESVLLVADVHIGKAVSFRRLGVPVPRGTTSETFERLSALIERLGAKRVIFLGDFLHSANSHAPATLAAAARWRERHASSELTLVRGNHDKRAGDPPALWRIDVVDEPLHLGGLALCHHPQPPRGADSGAHSGAYQLAGHLHPCISVGKGIDRLRLPCFHFAAAGAVLPAFGGFTGMHPIAQREDDLGVFLVAGERVLPLSAAQALRCASAT